MKAALRQTARRFLVAWNYVREVMGDRDYERYLELSRRRGLRPLSAEEFYVDSIKRRYSTVSRCC